MNSEYLNFFLNEQIQVNLISFIEGLLLAGVLSFVIQITYLKFSTSLSNKFDFSKNFIILGLTTTLVITIVKSSLALSLGLVGALSIVRFRAAIKEPEELVFLFLIIAVGLASGAGQLIPAIILTIFATLFIYIQSLLRKKKGIYTDVDILNLECPINSFNKVEKKIIDLFKKKNFTLNLKSMSKENDKIFLTFIISGVDDHNASELIISEIQKIDISELKINLTKGVPIAL